MVSSARPTLVQLLLNLSEKCFRSLQFSFTDSVRTAHSFEVLDRETRIIRLEADFRNFQIAAIVSKLCRSLEPPQGATQSIFITPNCSDVRGRARVSVPKRSLVPIESRSAIPSST
jgi:hypothetical protein